MLYKAKDILGCVVQAADGEVGRVKDLFFDDETWTLRYAVVETGTWLNSQEVLLVPAAMKGGDPASGLFYTDLTRQQVKDSPPVSSDMPVSRQYEERLHSYYGWMPYWEMPLYSAPGLYVYPPVGGLGPYPYAPIAPAGEGLADDPDAFREAGARRREEGDPHLRAFSEVKGYHIEAADGKLGHLIDVLIEPESWRVTHLVLDTRNWLPGKHVVVGAGVVRDIDWGESKISVTLSCEDIRRSPAYDPAKLVDDGYKSVLAAYYEDLPGEKAPIKRGPSEMHPS